MRSQGMAIIVMALSLYLSHTIGNCIRRLQQYDCASKSKAMRYDEGCRWFDVYLCALQPLQNHLIPKKELLAVPGVKKARSHSEWLLRGLTPPTPSAGVL